MPNALVTGALDRVPDIAIALKSAGFDIRAADTMSAADAARFLSRLSPQATVLLVTDDAGRIADDPGGSDDHRPPEPVPWWLYAGVDPDLGFADWRNSVFCLRSLPNP